MERGIFRAESHIRFPSADRLTLLIPKWLPAFHAPRGSVEEIAGLEIRAAGRALRWRRDPGNMYAFLVEMPEATSEVDLRYQLLTPTTRDQGRIVVTQDLLRLQWSGLCLYPETEDPGAIEVQSEVLLPSGWSSATALQPARQEPGRTAYEPTDLRTLIDSPILAGAYSAKEPLGEGVTLHIFADREQQLPRDHAPIDAYRRLVAEADALFGNRPFSNYVFLLAASDELGRVGLEHRASSENGVRGDLFEDWENSITEHDLLPHEYTHSWIGKYRVPAGNLKAGFTEPMTNELMWVYEGMTQYYGHILAARCNLISAAQTLDAVALIAATYDKRPGRAWRPLADTVHDPIITARQPKPWLSWQRSEDYYGEGFLLWLDADMLIRTRSRGARSLDDFALAFFRPEAPDAAPKPYDRADVIEGLNAVQPFDWQGFFAARVDDIACRAPLGGIENGGYRLVWNDMPSDWLRCDQHHNNFLDLSFSLGMKVGLGAKLIEVVWDSPAFAAGLTVGTELLAVDNRDYDNRWLLHAIDAGASSGAPISLLVRQRNRVRRVEIDYTGGQLYPALEPAGEGPRALDLALKPRAADERKPGER